MADHLPIPAPPAGSSWRDQFDYAVALQRHDDMTRQAAAIEAQTLASADATRALREATAVAAATPTDQDRWWAILHRLIGDDASRMIETKSMGFYTDAATLAVERSRSTP